MSSLSFSVTTRESRSHRATLNVRVAFPRRRLTVTTADGRIIPLPESPDEETGIPVAQFAMGLN